MGTLTWLVLGHHWSCHCKGFQAHSQDTYVTKQTTGILRRRWQAPELLLATDADSRTTFATDIYAFAMVCYEVNRLAFHPRATL